MSISDALDFFTFVASGLALTKPVKGQCLSGATLQQQFFIGNVGFQEPSSPAGLYWTAAISEMKHSYSKELHLSLFGSSLHYQLQ